MSTRRSFLFGLGALGAVPLIPRPVKPPKHPPTTTTTTTRPTSTSVKYTGGTGVLYADSKIWSYR